jgi:fructose-1,6-bisphosphatase/inositol monophosphatase family enzyme
MDSWPSQHSALLGVLADAADAIAAALDATADWGEAGTRPGQHHSDLAADAAAVAVLDAAGLGVLSEESGRQGADRPITVVLDPLDGSTNASRRMSWWATSLCAVDADGPLAALVVDLRHGTRYEAVRGEGARRDGVAIAASGCSTLGEAIVGLNGVPAGHGGWAQFRAFGAAALDLCAVADGTLDGYLDATTDELGCWDYLGGLLVCREAGAILLEAAGRDLVALDHGARRIPVAGATPELAAALADLHPRHGSVARP